MQKLAIGIIKKPHGIQGNLRVKSLSGEIGHFLLLEEIYLRTGNEFISYAIERIVMYSPDVLLKLKGIDTPEQGKFFCGREIWVERKYANPLENGEFYVSDLNRCDVFFRERHLGSVKSSIEMGISCLLEVESPARKSTLVPFTERFVENVDIERRQILLKEDSLFRDTSHPDIIS